MDTKYSFRTRNGLLFSAYTRPQGPALTASQVYALEDAYRSASQRAKKEMVPQCTQVDEAKHYEELLLKHLPNPESIRFLTLGSPSSPEERAYREAERLADAERKLAKAKASIPVLEKLIERLSSRKVALRPAKVVKERADPCGGFFPAEANPLEYSTTVTDKQLHA